MQHKIKEHFRGVPDEFMTNEFALKAKVRCHIGNMNMLLCYSSSSQTAQA